MDSITVQKLLPNNPTELHTYMFTVAEREELTATGNAAGAMDVKSLPALKLFS